MRIVIGNWSRRKLGGAENYIEGIVPGLYRRGHALALIHNVDTPPERARIALPDTAPAWCVAEMGARGAMAAARAWRPDVIYMQSYAPPSAAADREPDWAAELATTVPAAFFCHDYVGTCIGGSKAFKFPVIQPCSRAFGWPCLVHYYPRHCGGFNPVSMWLEYRKQGVRLDLLRACKAIVTASDAMREEYIKHGFAPETVYRLPLFPPASRESAELAPGAHAKGLPPTPEPLRLLFAGRMDRLKGGSCLLEALPRAARSLGRPLRVTFAGDGRERSAWRARAGEIVRESNLLSIDFPGWLTAGQVDALLAECHLVVVPSLWPEPFGLIGIEAGLHGVPAAAFDVGGIASWLQNGVNGYLASGNPPDSANLADAIARCLSDERTYAKLRAGAYAAAAELTLDRHLDALMKVLEKAAHG